jgi:Icc-related predicted phosphoesterase
MPKPVRRPCPSISVFWRNKPRTAYRFHFTRQDRRIARRRSVGYRRHGARHMGASAAEAPPSAAEAPPAVAQQRRCRLVLISDTHGRHRKLSMPEGEVLIHAGDFTHFGRLSDAKDLNEWFATLSYRRIFVVLGNHEANQDWVREAADVLSNATLLQHGGATAEGLRFFGCDFYWPAESWQPPYGAIPPDVDVLVVHGPCKGLVDGNAGCPLLLRHVLERVRPRLVVCGHIHEARGVAERDGITFVNAANCVGRTLKPPLVWELRCPAQRPPHVDQPSGGFG